MKTHSSENAQSPIAKMPVVMQILPRLETGGVERGTVDVAVALVEAGQRAIVVSAGGSMVREIERAGGQHVTLPVHSKNPLEMTKNTIALTSLMRTLDVDIVHARSRAPAWSARLAANRCGIPFVTTFHGTYNYHNPVKKAYNAIMAKGDRVIAISEFIARHITEFYHTPKERIRIISRGIDLETFSTKAVSAARIVQLAQSWRLPDNVRVIMLPGRLTRWKGQRVLIEAAIKITRQDVRVLLVGADQGRNKYRRELETLIARSGAQDRIHLTGPCRDMAAAYMLADVVVSASTDPEAFGRVAAEALAMGRPVIASDHGGARETVIAGKTGWLVPPGDAEALAEALDKALNMTREDREGFASRSISHIENNFSKQQMCRDTLAVYNELLAT